MLVSVSTGVYYQKSYKEILDVLKEAGTKYIELFFNDAFYNIDMETILNATFERDIKITSVHTPLPAIADKTGMSEHIWMKKAQILAEKAGAEVVVTHILSQKKKGQMYSLDEEHKKNIINFNRMDSNIYFTTENHSYLRCPSFAQNPEKLLEFLEETDTYLTFDTTHYAPTGDIIDGFLKFKKYIKNIHLSDYDFKNQRDHQPILEGNLPIERFIEILKENNYQGCLTLEYDFDSSKRCTHNSVEDQIYILRRNLEWLEKKLG